MNLFETKSKCFDGLFNNPSLMWPGQNTNHFDIHPAVVKAMTDSIASGEYHAYAPPLGIEELRRLILEDLGLSDASVLLTDGFLVVGCMCARVAKAAYGYPAR